MKEYRDNNMCSSCKDHKCCKKSWTRTDIGKAVHGVEPLFDVKDREKLKIEGKDVAYCNYRGEEGCIISWDKRPKQCKAYRCGEWLRAESNSDEELERLFAQVHDEISKSAKEDAEIAKRAFEEILGGKS